MPELIHTVLDLRDRCLTGDSDAWRTFIRTYGPLARHLVQHYFRSLPQRELLPEVFAAARENPADFWQSFRGQGQKEFLLHFRRHVLSVGRNRRGAAPETPLTFDGLSTLLKQFPQAQREMVILTIKGYQPEAVGLMTRAHQASAESIANQALQQIGARLASPGDHLALFADLENRRGEECLPDRFYVHFEDGGTVSWRDRESAERHFEVCLRCLVLLTDYRETHHVFRMLPPLEPEAEKALLQRLGFSGEVEPEKKPLWRRIWRSR